MMKLAVTSVLLTHSSESDVAEDDNDEDHTAKSVCAAPGVISHMREYDREREREKK